MAGADHIPTELDTEVPTKSLAGAAIAPPVVTLLLVPRLILRQMWPLLSSLLPQPKWQHSKRHPSQQQAHKDQQNTAMNWWFLPTYFQSRDVCRSGR